MGCLQSVFLQGCNLMAQYQYIKIKIEHDCHDPKYIYPISNESVQSSAISGNCVAQIRYLIKAILRLFTWPR